MKWSVVLVGIFGLSASAQQSAVLIEYRFAQSTQQWLCRELQSANPDVFDCHHLHPQKPVMRGAEVPELTGQEIFWRLLFPDSGCERYLKLCALSDLYKPLLSRKLQQHQLPENFRYLALMASGFNQHYNDGRQRAGLWALSIPAARWQHLRVDNGVDERCGGDFTTDAAVKYLSYLFSQYNGDERKTITAFLKSPAFVQMADWTSDPDALFLWHFYLYLPALFDANPAPNRLNDCFEILSRYESVFFTSDVTIATLAAVLDLPLPQLTDPNPVYTGRVVPGAYRKVPFLIPKNLVPLWRQKEQEIYRLSTAAEPTPVSHAEWYVVKEGDTLERIARRHHTSVKQIMLANKLQTDRIRPGQKLKLNQSVK